MVALLNLVLAALLISGCVGDRGAWATLDDHLRETKPLSSQIPNEKAFYVHEWGEPLAHVNTVATDAFGSVVSNGQGLLWLWKADGTGPSERADRGWELILSFNDEDNLVGWKVGTYRTGLTLADVITATRKASYVNNDILVDELGLGASQHGIATRNDITLSDRMRHQFVGHSHRERVISNLQRNVLALANVIHRLDLAAQLEHIASPKQPERLATETEILQYIVLNWLAAPGGQRGSRENPDEAAFLSASSASLGFDGLVGNWFLGPITPNAYGPGINMDATGRPFSWRPMGPGSASFDPFLRVQPNAYGPGIGMDQYGRPVTPGCPPGWAGPC
jgi:hypothetical protein